MTQRCSPRCGRARLTLAWTTTADPDVPADLVVLADGKPALVQAENVVPLYRRNELTDRQLLAINEVAGVLDTAALVEMRRQVADGADRSGRWPTRWLAEHPLGALAAQCLPASSAGAARAQTDRWYHPTHQPAPIEIQHHLASSGRPAPGPCSCEPRPG